MKIPAIPHIGQNGQNQASIEGRDAARCMGEGVFWSVICSGSLIGAAIGAIVGLVVAVFAPIRKSE